MQKFNHHSDFERLKKPIHRGSKGFRISRFLQILFICLTAGIAHATIDAYQFENDVLRDRYQGLIAELRCPKCQNQNLAGSDSAVAQDLRREVYDQLMAGRADSEIRQFMRDRYGDFILYDPPLNGITLIVWLIPIFIFAVAAFAALAVIRNAIKRNNSADTSAVKSADKP